MASDAKRPDDGGKGPHVPTEHPDPGAAERGGSGADRAGFDLGGSGDHSATGGNVRPATGPAEVDPIVGDRDHEVAGSATGGMPGAVGGPGLRRPENTGDNADTDDPNRR